MLRPEYAGGTVTIARTLNPQSRRRHNETRSHHQRSREHYAAVARGEASACGAPAHDVARAIGYSDEELALAGDANLGLGCGNPLALTELRPGMTVVDLGSGAGFDAFLAWNRVGPTGRVIGVDMTDDMLALARAERRKTRRDQRRIPQGIHRRTLPVESASVDYVISNCVINLSSDKPAVFREIARVLKPGGHFAVSDIVLLKPLPEEFAQRHQRLSSAALPAPACSPSISTSRSPRVFATSPFPASLKDQTWSTYLRRMASTGKTSCCGSTVSVTSLKNPDDLVQQAADALASIKLHGRK